MSGEAASEGTGRPIVATDLGAVRGVRLGDRAAAFRGIPYAAPPTGLRRWRAAGPASAWAGVRDADDFGPICPQREMPGAPPLPQDEDCLTLNIVTPDPDARGLPVLFSIHGGAFFVGSGRYIAEKDLTPIVRRGVVLVSANYRLGRFGFLAHPALTAEAGHGSGNFWLTDQIAALCWVRRNIDRFGGDPGQVTILGCSAGGSSVNALMATPAARGLFARASVHSGGGLFNASRTLAAAEAQGLAFARRAGIADDDPAPLDALRKLSVEAILAADPGPPDFGAIVDGHLIERPAAAAFARGERAAVPLMIGSTSNEASIFGMMGFDAATMRTRFGIEVGDVRGVYEADGTLADGELMRRVQTDFLFTAASVGLASLAARTAPTWCWHFDHVPQAQRATKPGASHCADMPYVLLDDPRRDAADQAVAERRQGYWYNFIARGNPNGAGLPDWPQVTPGDVRARVIGPDGEAMARLHPERIALWHARYRDESGVDI